MMYVDWSYAGQVTVCAILLHFPLRAFLRAVIDAALRWDAMGAEGDE